MAIKTLEVSGAGASEVYALPMKAQDWSVPNGFSLIVNFSGNVATDTGAVATVSVQVSNDPRAVSAESATRALARWNDLDCMSDLEDDKNDTLAAPVAFVRLYCSSYTSGTVQLGIGFPDQL